MGSDDVKVVRKGGGGGDSGGTMVMTDWPRAWVGQCWRERTFSIKWISESWLMTENGVVVDVVETQEVMCGIGFCSSVYHQTPDFYSLVLFH